MRHGFVILMLLLAQPLYATSLQFNLAGTYTAGFDPGIGGTFNVSYPLNTPPSVFTYADVLAPDGTTVHDYLTGTEFFSASVSSMGGEPFPHVGTVLLQLGGLTPVPLWAFSMSQYISSSAFNRYQYHFSLFALGDAFIYMEYVLGFSPPLKDGIWDRSFLESLSDPDTLLERAVLGDTAAAMIEISQFNIDLNVERFTITAAQVSEPNSAALIAAGLIFLIIANQRRARREDLAEA